jgi:hypothetical protein
MRRIDQWETGRGRRAFAVVPAIACLLLIVVFIAIAVAGSNSSQLAGAGSQWSPVRIRAVGGGYHGIVLEAFGRAVRIEFENALK